MARLIDIIEHKRKEIERDKSRESLADLKKIIESLPPTKDFLWCMKKTGINIIAETKIKSPSMDDENKRGMIELAEEYELNNGKIAAISVLTDEEYFGGSLETMRRIRRMTSKPLLRKDFILEEYQVYQSRAYGADAMLLMSSVLETEEMRRLIDLGNELGMKCLVEFSTKEDRGKIPDNVEIYGRNYRKLTLSTDFADKENIFKCYDEIQTADTLIEELPKEVIKVAESQIKGRSDIDYLKSKGYDAFLMGTTISFSKDISNTLLTLTSPH